MDKNIKCYADGYNVDSKKAKYFPMLPSENFVRIYREFIKFKKNLTFDYKNLFSMYAFVLKNE